MQAPVCANLLLELFEVDLERLFEIDGNFSVNIISFCLLELKHDVGHVVERHVQHFPVLRLVEKLSVLINNQLACRIYVCCLRRRLLGLLSWSLSPENVLHEVGEDLCELYF